MPEQEPSLPYDPQALRKQAEEAAAEQFVDDEFPSPDRTPQFLHELRVHQIELQMQNRALREAQAELEISRDRYADLFDFAPVGYITVDEVGAVCEINLTACTMLGVQRGRVLGKRLAAYVPAEVKDRFLEYLRACRRAEPDEELIGEFLLGDAPEGEVSVLVRTGIASEPDTTGRKYRLVLTDISPQKRAENALRALNETLERRVAERAAAVQLLCDVAVTANHASSVREALAFCLQRVGEHAGWLCGQAWLPADDDLDLLVPVCAWHPPDRLELSGFHEGTLRSPLRRGEGLPGRAYATAEPHWVSDLARGLQPARAQRARELGLTAAAAFPIMAESHSAGVLEFFAERPLPPDAEMADLVFAVGTQLGRVIERKRLQDRLLSLADDEHRRIGQELHDDVGQELTGLALYVETLTELLTDSKRDVSELAGKIGAVIARIRRKTRNLSRGLVPMEIDAPALETALEGLALQISEVTPTACTYRSRGRTRVAARRTATQLYRIAQEAVSNATKHSRAKNVEIELAVDGAGAVLEIRDDGQGLPAEHGPPPGVGLQIMRYRAELIGGTLTVESPTSGGTRVRCRVPQIPMEGPLSPEVG